MKLTNWLSSPTAEALGWTLIHALWQGFAVVLTVAVLLYLARQSQAIRRYQIGMGGLLLQVIASLGTFGWYYTPTVSGVSSSPSVHPALTIPRLAFTATANESWLMTTQAFLNAHLAQVVWIWLIGVGVFGLRLVGGWVYVQRLQRTATLPVPAMLSDATARLTRSMNVSARLQLSSRVAGPLVVGVLKPVILWPVGLLAGLSAADVDAILAHELAHVRRHDYLLNVLQSTVEVLYFFHPALWWLSARVREEREHCCDDLAVATVGDARVLARALARVEEWQGSATNAPVLTMAFASKRQLLLQRVRRMLGVPTRPLVSNGSLVGLTLITVLLLSVSVYAVQRVDQPKPVRTTWPKVTRRHTVSNDSEYGMINSQRIGYVVWKGQRLPAARIARLQRQLDLVKSGKLSLDGVAQPDRDILLTIIEKNQAFDGGMTALASGLPHIDLTNIEVAPAVNVPAIADIPDQLIDSINVNGQMINVISHYVYPAAGGDTSRLRAVQQQLEILTKQLKELMAERQPMADKLSKEMAELAAKNGEASSDRSQIGKMARQQQALAAKMITLQRESQTLSRQNSAKAKALLQQREAQTELLEKQLSLLDEQMTKLDSRLEPQRERLGVLADSLAKLYEPTNVLSEKMGALAEQLSEQIEGTMRRAEAVAEQAERQAEEAMRRAEEITSGRHQIKGDTIYYFPSTRAPRPARPAQPSRPARPAKAPRAPRPAVSVVPAPAAVPRPDPATAPKPAAAPKPPREERGRFVLLSH